MEMSSLDMIEGSLKVITVRILSGIQSSGVEESLAWPKLHNAK
jgi:hypothetical protein